MSHGHLYVISAPSGTGKTSVVHRLRTVCPQLAHSISYTTRQPRPNERDGVDYYFVDPATFQGMVERGEFIEWARVHDHGYGTPKRQIEAILASGRDVMLDIDVQGAATVKRMMPEATLIFLVPPSLEVLERRLHQRGTESPEVIERRLRQAAHELAQQQIYDHVIVCNTIEETCAHIVDLMQNHRRSVGGATIP